jgi:DNA-binding Xre family transcriptional regulator
MRVTPAGFPVPEFIPDAEPIESLVDTYPSESIHVTKLRVKVLSVPQPQYQIAALAGIHPSIMSMYVRGEKPIRDKHLIALCELFRCEPDDIMGWIDTSAFFEPTKRGSTPP